MGSFTSVRNRWHSQNELMWGQPAYALWFSPLQHGSVYSGMLNMLWGTWGNNGSEEWLLEENGERWLCCQSHQSAGHKAATPAPALHLHPSQPLSFLNKVLVLYCSCSWLLDHVSVVMWTLPLNMTRDIEVLAVHMLVEARQKWEMGSAFMVKPILLNLFTALERKVLSLFFFPYIFIEYQV